jgi:hypothetical protein
LNLAPSSSRDRLGLVLAARQSPLYRRDLTFDPGATPPGFLVYLVFMPRFIIGLIITDFAQLTLIMNFSCICGIAVVGRGLIT